MMSKKTVTICNVCGKESQNEEQQRHENWLQLKGQLNVWLERPRAKGSNYMHSVGWKDQGEDFCSLECLVTALKADVSLP
jgi:predicted metal-binding protein